MKKLDRILVTLVVLIALFTTCPAPRQKYKKELSSNLLQKCKQADQNEIPPYYWPTPADPNEIPYWPSPSDPNKIPYWPSPQNLGNFPVNYQPESTK